MPCGGDTFWSFLILMTKMLAAAFVAACGLVVLASIGLWRLAVWIARWIVH